MHHINNSPVYFYPKLGLERIMKGNQNALVKETSRHRSIHNNSLISITNPFKCVMPVTQREDGGTKIF